MFGGKMIKLFYTILYIFLITGCVRYKPNNYHNSFFNIQSDFSLASVLSSIQASEASYYRSLYHRKEEDPSFKYKDVEDVRLEAYEISENFPDFLARYEYLLGEYTAYVDGTMPEYIGVPLGVKGRHTKGIKRDWYNKKVGVTEPGENGSALTF
jgi:hypothetical protein